MENQPFIFIKPHAFGSDLVMDYINTVFEKKRISSLCEGVITGPEIRAGLLVDRHYSMNARVGTVRDPSILNIGDAGRRIFRETFGEDWDRVISERRMLSGLSLQEKLGINAEQVNDIWMAASPKTKVAGGHYAAYSKANDVYILNGFYPVVRERYMADDASIRYRILTFRSRYLTWKDFRQEVIGSTNPADAHPESIRGYLYAHAREYGIQVNNGDNVIHASASPFEALIEKYLWLPNYDYENSPLYVLLAKSGMSIAGIYELYDQKPLVTLKSGVTGTLLDVLEDKDTDDVAEILKELYL